MAPAAASPALVFTSIGKKVMTTTTAAFDGQSKPNHITMIGAMPTIGRARDEIAERQQAALQEGHAIDQDGDEEACAGADDVAGGDRLDKVCRKSTPSTGSEPAKRSPMAEGGGRITGGTPKPRTTPSQRNSSRAEDDRHGEIAERAQEAALRRALR